MKLKPYQVALVLSCTLFLRSGCSGPSKEDIFTAMQVGNFTALLVSIVALYILFLFWRKLVPELVFPQKVIGIFTAVFVAFQFCSSFLLIRSLVPNPYYSYSYKDLIVVGGVTCGTSFLSVSLIMFRLLLWKRPRFAFTGALLVPCFLFFTTSTATFLTADLGSAHEWADKGLKLLFLFNAIIGGFGIVPVVILLALSIELFARLREKKAAAQLVLTEPSAN